MEGGADVDLIKEFMEAFKKFLDNLLPKEGDISEWSNHAKEQKDYVTLLDAAKMIKCDADGLPVGITQKGLDFLLYLGDPPTWSPIRNKYKFRESDFTVDSLYESLKQQYELNSRSGR